MIETIELGHVMSREKYNAIHAQRLKEQLDAELLKILTSPVQTHSTEQPVMQYVQFSIDVVK